MVDLLVASEGPRHPSSLPSLKLCAALLFILWAVILAKHLENRSDDYNAAVKQLQNLSILTEANTLRTIGELDLTLRSLRNAIAVAPEPKNFFYLVSTAHVVSSILVQVAVIDHRGLLLASSARREQFPPIDLSDREHFQFHRNNQADVLFISKPVVGRASGKQSIQFTRPLLNPQGEFDGVVVASFDPTHFNTIFEKVDLGSGAAFALIGTDGVVRAIGGQARQQYKIGEPAGQLRLTGDLTNGTAASYWESNSLDQMQDLVVVRRILNQPLYVVARMPAQAVYASSDHNLHLLLLAGAALSLLITFIGRRSRQVELEQKRKDSELHKMHEALAESNARLQQSEAEARRKHKLFEGVFASAPDGMIFTDNSRLIIDANAALLSTFGYAIDELRGRSTKCLYHKEEEWRAIGEQVTQATAISTEVTGLRKCGEAFPCKLTLSVLRDQTGTVMGWVGVTRDLTTERRRDAALQQKHRLEALGRLTGGIAHDFNNLLAVISGNLELAGLQPTNDKQRNFLSEAMKAVKMGAKLNERLITFARQRTLDGSTIDLNDLVTTMLPMIELTVGAQITVTTSFQKPAVVHVDVSEMENTLLNLATNARDAMSERGGHLSYATSVESVDSDMAEIIGAEPGNFVRLRVSDTGIGMPPDVVSQAFDPFFTTKDTSKGAGLGLTTIDGFIRQSGGHIAIDSKVGRGTTIDIYLPVSTHQVTAKNTMDTSQLPISSAARKVILVVEDKHEVRSTVRGQLEELGFDVIEASNGDSALSILEKGVHVDLLFSDVVMPGAISGIELCRRSTEARPDLPILLTSGFSQSYNFTSAPILPMLQKPYTLSELAKAIDGAIGRQHDLSSG